MNQKIEFIINKIIVISKTIYYHIYEPIRLWYERYLSKPSAGNPLISVYCPTYNRSQLLIDRAVKSVLAQTYTNFEFIIIGDHCTDDTEESLSKIKDSRIKFYNLPYRRKRYPPTADNHWFAGPVVPANEALSRVNGEWIARIDDDDEWHPKHLEILLKHALKHKLEFVSGDIETIQFGEKKVIRAKDESPPIGGTQTWLYRSYLKFFKYNIDCWRKSWNRVNDYDLQDRMYHAGVKIGYVNKVVTFVYPRPGDETISSKAYRSKPKEIEKFYKFEE